MVLLLSALKSTGSWKRTRHAPSFSFGPIKTPTTAFELPEYDSSREHDNNSCLNHQRSDSSAGVISRSRHLVRMGILHSPMTIATRNRATERSRAFLQID